MSGKRARSVLAQRPAAHCVAYVYCLLMFVDNKLLLTELQVAVHDD